MWGRMVEKWEKNPVKGLSPSQSETDILTKSSFLTNKVINNPLWQYDNKEYL